MALQHHDTLDFLVQWAPTLTYILYIRPSLITLLGVFSHLFFLKLIENDKPDSEVDLICVFFSLFLFLCVYMLLLRVDTHVKHGQSFKYGTGWSFFLLLALCDFKENGHHSSF